MKIEDKIRLIINDKLLSSSQFADKLNIQRSTVSHILAGRNKPSYDVLTKILSTFPNINSDWLLRDATQMYLDSNEKSKRLFDDVNEKNQADKISISETPDINSINETSEKTNLHKEISEEVVEDITEEVLNEKIELKEEPLEELKVELNSKNISETKAEETFKPDNKTTNINESVKEEKRKKNKQRKNKKKKKKETKNKNKQITKNTNNKDSVPPPIVMAGASERIIIFNNDRTYTEYLPKV